VDNKNTMTKEVKTVLFVLHYSVEPWFMI